MSETKRDLYNSVKWQNEMIDVENARIRDKYSTDLQRVKHMHQDVMGWNVVNLFLWWIYYIFRYGSDKDRDFIIGIIVANFIDALLEDD